MVIENAQFKQVLSLIKIIYKISGKSHTKIILRYYEQTVKVFDHLIVFTSLHRLFCFTLTFLSEFVVKYLKTSSFFWIFLCRNSSLTKTTDSYSFLCCCCSPSAFCLSFAFFLFAFWPIETTTANLQGLTHSKPSKSIKPSHPK